MATTRGTTYTTGSRKTKTQQQTQEKKARAINRTETDSSRRSRRTLRVMTKK